MLFWGVSKHWTGLDWTGLEWNGILDFDPSAVVCLPPYCTALQLLTSLGGRVEETIQSLAPSIAGALDYYKYLLLVHD